MSYHKTGAIHFTMEDVQKIANTLDQRLHRATEYFFLINLFARLKLEVFRRLKTNKNKQGFYKKPHKIQLVERIKQWAWRAFLRIRHNVSHRLDESLTKPINLAEIY